MKKDIEIILDNCIERILLGEDAEQVLSEYPDVRDQIEPLVRSALHISRIPKVTPSAEFVATSKTSLLRKICCEKETASQAENRSWFARFGESFTTAWQNLTSTRRLSAAISVTLALALIIVVGQFTFMKDNTALASPCVLRILSGSVSVQESDSDAANEASDGMNLDTGDIIMTQDNSHALIAFFDGSTIKLDPGTTIEIMEMEDNESEDSSVIVLKQWLGRTWSRVIKMTDADSRYEIETPSATAVVRGTLFATEVSDNGSMSLSTTRGLVSVTAENQEVFVAANHSTATSKGDAPAQPVVTPGPISEIVITIDGPVAGSINDPTGSSTGQLPDGFEFNQIPGSNITFEDGKQVIRISDPTSGDYNLALRFMEDMDVTCLIEGLSNGETAFSRSYNLSDKKDNGLSLSFNLQVEASVMSLNQVKVKALGEENPEKIVDIASLKNAGSPGQEKKNEDTTTSDESDNNGNNVNDSAPGQNKNTDTDSDSGNSNSGNGKSDNAPGQNKDDDTSDTDSTVTDADDSVSSNNGNSDNSSGNGKDNAPGQNKDDSSSTGNGNSSNGNSSTQDVDTGVTSGNGKDSAPGQNKTNGTSDTEDTATDDTTANNGNGNSGNNKNKSDVEDASSNSTTKTNNGKKKSDDSSTS